VSAVDSGSSARSQTPPQIGNQEHAKDLVQSIAVKKEKNQKEACRADANTHMRDDVCTAPMGSSKMSQEFDADRQFLEYSENDMQQSLQSKTSAARKYEWNIKTLNEQLITLRPNAIRLKMQDVKVE
jgi:hypothetical protein